MLCFLLKIEQLQSLSFHHAWHQEDSRDRAVPYLKNDSSGDFQHSKQLKLMEKYLSKHSKIHKGKQTCFLTKVNSRCFFFPFSGRLVGASQRDTNMASRVRNIAQTWRLDRFLVYILPTTCQFLDFIHGMFSIFFRYFLIFIFTNSPWDRWAYNRTLGPMLKKPTSLPFP